VIDEAAFAAALRTAKAGDESGWRILVGEITPAVLNLAGRACHPDAEDLLADVLVGIVKGIQRFTGARDDFHAWVATIAHRRLADWRSRTARRRQLDCEPPDQRDESQAAALDLVADLVDLEALLEVLDDRQREVLLLRTVAEVPASDVAAHLGTSPANVRVIAHRAIRRLQRSSRQL
jgi:RNA polymerase sigma-70 factor (ECF subfamily)